MFLKNLHRLNRSCRYSTVLKEFKIDGFERIIAIDDKITGLKCIISIHNSSLGPTLGGLRIFPYKSFEEAFIDANRLSEGMSYKSALAGIGLGGGKSVIISDPKDVTHDMLKKYADILNYLEGKYICAEDSGSTIRDIDYVSEYTKYATGLSHSKSSGNPSIYTAWGTYRGIQATLDEIYGKTEINGKTVAIQGVGSVGRYLADFLYWNGANIIVSDINNTNTELMATRYNAKIVSPTEIYSQKCDIFAPCGMGGTINSQTIPLLKCKAIAGCANNQLLYKENADELEKYGILYAPDFAINAGGIINVSAELEKDGYNPINAKKAVDKIYNTIKYIFSESKKPNTNTYKAAINIAKYQIENKIGERKEKPNFPSVNYYKNKL